jgi:cholesterol transport system auxiliary component
VVQVVSVSLLLLLSLLLGACASAPPAPRDHFYRLAPAAHIPPGHHSPTVGTLRVTDLAARGFLGGRQIVFRTQDQPLETRRYNEYLWEVPPGQALAQSLASALQDAGLFRLVTGPTQDTRAQFVLGGDISRFEHLATLQPPRVAIAFSLLLVKTDDRRPLFAHQYQGEEPMSANNPDAMVEAFDRLAGRLIGDAVRDLRANRPRLSSTRTGSWPIP